MSYSEQKHGAALDSALKKITPAIRRTLTQFRGKKHAINSVLSVVNITDEEKKAVTLFYSPTAEPSRDIATPKDLELARNMAKAQSAVGGGPEGPEGDEEEE